MNGMMVIQHGTQSLRVPMEAVTKLQAIMLPNTTGFTPDARFVLVTQFRNANPPEVVTMEELSYYDVIIDRLPVVEAEPVD